MLGRRGRGRTHEGADGGDDETGFEDEGGELVFFELAGFDVWGVLVGGLPLLGFMDDL